MYYSSGAEEKQSDYGNSDADEINYSNNKDMDEYSMAAEDDDPRKPEQNYVVLKEPNIRRRQEKQITEVSTVLAISKAAATVLLLHYNWRVYEVHDAWFADEEGVRKAAGLLEKPVVEFPKKNGRKVPCSICLETCSVRVMRWVACGHPFCSECWGNYITTSVQDGPGCLMLRCPAPSCGAAVGQDMVESLASAEEKQRYSRYLMRSYIESNKRTKWCPAPDCEYAVEFSGEGAGRYDVRCLCSTSFCWNCLEDAHRPVDCSTVAKWVLKNSSEAENVTWILAKTKPCPKCRRPIEKNLGCMHMSCGSPCKHQFCWLCLGPWDKHNGCNTYKNSTEMKEFDNIRERAKKSLDRYNHYYERWVGNQSSRKQAVRDFHETQTEHMKKLSELHGQPDSHLQFITQAWLQIIECRRVLKWTYAYGYYIPENEKTKKTFFEYLQGEAESGLEKLHHCAETEIHEVLKEGSPAEKLNNFRTKLTGLTRVTRNYFENLVQALENGLEDVYSQEACSEEKDSKEPREGRTGKRNWETARTSRSSRSRSLRGTRSP